MGVAVSSMGVPTATATIEFGGNHPGIGSIKRAVIFRAMKPRSVFSVLISPRHGRAQTEFWIMNESRNGLLTIVPVLIMSFGLAACSSEPQANAGETREASLAATPAERTPAESAGVEDSQEGARSEGEGEHSEGAESREGGEHDEGSESEEGEEGGVYIGRGDTWDTTRRGARLVLTFNPSSNAFAGTVANMTGSTLCAVRVEVHLSNGTELGPTARTDLSAGQSTEVELSTGGAVFDTWTAHPEISGCSGD